MSVSEQELFGLMAVAQEQQQAAAVALERLEAQRAGLEQTIEQARAAVREMEMAGKASALIIEKATRLAVSEAVSGALVAVRDETVKTLGGSVKPAVSALEGVTGRAEQAEQRLSQAAASFSWQWGALWAGTAALLLAVVVVGDVLGRPSPGAAPGGTTRTTWPTSMALGFSKLLQRAMSFQLWPCSKPMRIKVSPGLTV